MILKLPWNSFCYAKFCCDLQIRSVAAPELCVDTEDKKADERFGLKECVKDNRRSKGEQVCLLVFCCYIILYSCYQLLYCFVCDCDFKMQLSMFIWVMCHPLAINQPVIGGLVVSMLASGTQDRGFKPGQGRHIFQGKKSSARLPSEGK
jgi:hypothetical protein